MSEKMCSKCRLSLDMSSFHKNKARHDGLSNYCKSCMRKANKNWYERNKEKRLRQISDYAKANPEKRQRIMNGCHEKRPMRYAYIQQRSAAKKRGIPFNITYKEWVNWWGEDFSLRGRGPNDLQMCRKNDVGAYEIGNIYKATGTKNKADYAKISRCPDTGRFLPKSDGEQI